MRRLIVIILILAIGYGGYWFIGARAVENGAVDGLNDLQSAGWQVDYSDLSTRGFPSRFDTTITDLRLTSPDGNASYAAPFVQAFALSYQPNRMIVAFPNSQTVILNGIPTLIESEGLKMSGGVVANRTLTFDAATMAAEALAITVEGGPIIRSGATLAAFRATPEPLTYDAYAQIKQITLPDSLWKTMFPNAELPLNIEAMTLSAIVATDQPIDHQTLTSPNPPRIVAMDVSTLSLAWGPLSLDLAGSLTVDPDGTPSGGVTVTATNWAMLIQGLTNIGILDQQRARLVLQVANSMAAGSDTLEIPITLRSGQMYIGPIPIGPAPRFR